MRDLGKSWGGEVVVVVLSSIGASDSKSGDRKLLNKESRVPGYRVTLVINASYTRG